jgi:hypothetical protein
MLLLVIGGFINLIVVLFILTKRIKRVWLYLKLDGLVHEIFLVYLVRKLFMNGAVFLLIWNFILGMLIFGIPLWLISKVFSII